MILQQAPYRRQSVAPDRCHRLLERLTTADAIASHQRDGRLSLVVDNTGATAKPGRTKPPASDDGDFDFDDRDAKTGIEKW